MSNKTTNLTQLVIDRNLAQICGVLVQIDMTETYLVYHDTDIEVLELLLGDLTSKANNLFGDPVKPTHCIYKTARTR